MKYFFSYGEAEGLPRFPPGDEIRRCYTSGMEEWAEEKDLVTFFFSLVTPLPFPYPRKLGNAVAVVSATR